MRGKVALVTDESRGIGAATALESAREGIYLCTATRDSDRVARAAENLRQTGQIHQCIPFRLISATQRRRRKPLRRQSHNSAASDRIVSRPDEFTIGESADRSTLNVERVLRERMVSQDDAVTFLLSTLGARRVGWPEAIGTIVAYLASATRSL